MNEHPNSTTRQQYEGSSRGPSQKAMAKMEAEITAQLPVPKPKKATKTRTDVPSEHRSIKLWLPWPPSVNHYWRRNRNGSVRISEKGEQFRAEVIEKCRNRDGVMGRVTVEVVAHPPDRRKRDLDNIFKALLDALNHAEMIEDDGLIDYLSVTRSFVVPHGEVTVTIESMKD